MTEDETRPLGPPPEGDPTGHLSGPGTGETEAHPDPVPRAGDPEADLFRDAEASTGGPGTGRWSPPPGFGLLALSIWASIALVVAYILSGGLDYRPAEAADPCQPRVWAQTETLEQTAEQFALSALDGAACELGVSRAELTRALANPDSLRQFAVDNGFTDQEVDVAIRSGANKAIDDAEAAGAISALVALGLRTAVDTLPLTELIDLLQNASELFGGSGDLGALLDSVLGSLGGGSGGEFDLGTIIEGVLGNKGSGGLRDQLPEGLGDLIPNDPEQIQKGLEGLFGPR